jgi:hypothetical protein
LRLLAALLGQYHVPLAKGHTDILGELFRDIQVKGGDAHVLWLLLFSHLKQHPHSQLPELEIQPAIIMMHCKPLFGLDHHLQMLRIDDDSQALVEDCPDQGHLFGRMLKGKLGSAEVLVAALLAVSEYPQLVCVVPGLHMFGLLAEQVPSDSLEHPQYRLSQPLALHTPPGEHLIILSSHPKLQILNLPDHNAHNPSPNLPISLDRSQSQQPIEIQFCVDIGLEGLGEGQGRGFERGERCEEGGLGGEQDQGLEAGD